MIKAFCDAILIAISFILAYFFRFKVLLFITPQSLPIFDRYFNLLIFIVILWLALFKLIGLYDERKTTSLIDELANLFLGVTAASLTLLGLLFLNRELWFSRIVVVTAWWLSFVLMAFLRGLIVLTSRQIKARGFGLKRVLIIGGGEMAGTIASRIKQDRSLGYQVVEILADLPDNAGRVLDLVRSKNISQVIIASGEIGADRILDLVTECERFGVSFKLVPGILELIASRVDVDELGGIPLLTVTEIKLQGLNALIKRVSDILLSGLVIVILSPILLLAALLVKLTSPGPVLFKQSRVGLDGKLFPIFKFRSMIRDAEEKLGTIAHLSETGDEQLFKIKNDPRLTPLGKFMRRFSIDELPQLFNVLFGQMSLVGPRPPLPREVEKYSPWHKKRLRVRPGISGPWQVAGRSQLPFEDMVRLDIYYIENWSLWLDFKILLRTIPVVLFGTGAY